jgi:hypothetical protein
MGYVLTVTDGSVGVHFNDSSNNFGSSASSSLTQVATCSPVPASNPSPYASMHLESVSLPPVPPPVLCGTILVHNIVFGKYVGVQFTLDDWMTVSEVLATYTGPVASLEMLAGTNQDKMVGNLISSMGARGSEGGTNSTSPSSLRIMKTYLWQHTLYLITRYTAPSVGEFWDNNLGENYRLTFHSHSGPMQPERKRASGKSAKNLAGLAGLFHK